MLACALTMLMQPTSLAWSSQTAGDLVIVLEDRNGDPLAGKKRWIDALRLDDGREFGFFASDTSRAEASLPPGRYKVEAKDFEVGARCLSYADVRPGERTTLRLGGLPAQAIQVRGRVTYGGEAVEGARIYGQLPVWPTPLGTYAETRADGSFELALEQKGAWRFQVRRPGWALNERGWNIILEYDFRYEVVSEQAVRLKAWDLPKRSVEGTVRGPDSQPIAGHVVRIRSSSGERTSTALTDEQGRFAFRGLGLEPMGLSVGGPDYFSQGNDLIRYAFQAQHLSPAVQEPIHLQLATGGELQCKVLDENGNPIPSAYVTARSGTSPWFALGKTNQEGLVHAKGMPIGPLELSCMVRGRASRIGASVKIVRDGVTEHALMLSFAPRLAITARGPDNMPPLLRVLEILDERGQAVFLLGQHTTFTPLARSRPLPKGRYVIRVESPRGDIHQRSVAVEDTDQSLVFDFSPNDR